MLLVLAGATDEAVVANYEAGFRGAAQHRGHGLAFGVEAGQWVVQAEKAWGEEELEAALAERRPALMEWLRTFDVEAYVLGSGVELATVARLKQLLV